MDQELQEIYDKLQKMDLDELIGEVNKTKTKFLVVCGGVASGIGKGITISSIASLLQRAGSRVSLIKIDPYLNQDAGTMSPFEHGECYVLNDGGEVDLDLGNYERFLEVNFTKDHNITSGKVYDDVLRGERAGNYLGKTVQFIPHVTNKIKERILRVSQIPIDGTLLPPEICLIEIGGTVGDQESIFFYETIRQLKNDVKDVLVILIAYVPKIKDEYKTKPSQNAIRNMNQLGLNPNIVVLRSQQEIDEHSLRKVAAYSNLQESEVINIPDKKILFEVPYVIAKAMLIQTIQSRFNLPIKLSDLYVYKCFCRHLQIIEELPKIQICIVGKYITFKDAYLSIIKAFEVAGFALTVSLKLCWVESIQLEDDFVKDEETKLQAEKAWEIIKSSKGIFIPGGYGNRGFRGKIKAAQYARENKIPCFGVCFGFQAMVIEYAINVLGIADAYSEEHEDKFPSKNHIIKLLPDTSLDILGGTMRLGTKKTIISDKSSLAYKMYQKSEIFERHRHRYEFNKDYLEQYEKTGFKFSGVDETGIRYSVFEFQNHPFYFGTQFHPEFNNKYTKPCPTYCAFLASAAGKLEDNLKKNNGLFKISLLDAFPDEKKNIANNIV
ncbi:CTP synthase (macronuclear) [Tetrahymena thermophila SB210]|uniref:CTP synthase n=1 Tax=Tetrahymena thermophila (strain SB210) TaxID=312017 RepID=I7MM56_TETTS|nr:CTP synthase [Tetrahymena thermophila SB210]EAS04002.1 CTP synthase [Tetrahymena thermophila SB210]|eukprot:XP_001024247.1 CTP synthase [Tetrahymena thermophila SB210]